jgi:hypothetical protein
VTTAEVGARYSLPAAGWTLRGAIAPQEPRTATADRTRIRIESNTLGDPADLQTAIKLVELTREIGNSPPPLASTSDEKLCPANSLAMNSKTSCATRPRPTPTQPAQQIDGPR